MERFISLFGYVTLLCLAWLMSSHKRIIPWRVIIGGTLMQFAFAICILKTTPGLMFFSWIGDVFTSLLDFSDQGAKFVFGDKFKDFFFAFKVLPTIIFVSSLMSVLYYLGLMQWVVNGLAWLMQRTLGTSGAETLSASANVFMGQTEAPLLIKPYLGAMTLSELNAVMVGGFATISGGLLALFVGMKIPAGHLVTASVISAPASLLIAKIMLPETEKPVTLGATEFEVPSAGVNLIEAAANGATDGMKLAINVAAMLIAFIALIAMCDKGLSMLGELFHQTWSLKGGLGYGFSPIAGLMGMEWKDCFKGGELLALKMALNEVIAYGELTNSKSEMSERSFIIMTYALCGFSNFSSIAVQIGGLGAIAPERKSDIARLGLRAMLGGTLACCLTGCVAGVIL
jgi:CNT family concentrative nucleoside transporter